MCRNFGAMARNIIARTRNFGENFEEIAANKIHDYRVVSNIKDHGKTLDVIRTIIRNFIWDLITDSEQNRNSIKMLLACNLIISGLYRIMNTEITINGVPRNNLNNQHYADLQNYIGYVNSYVTSLGIMGNPNLQIVSNFINRLCADILKTNHVNLNPNERALNNLMPDAEQIPSDARMPPLPLNENINNLAFRWKLMTISIGALYNLSFGVIEWSILNIEPRHVNILLHTNRFYSDFHLFLNNIMLNQNLLQIIQSLKRNLAFIVQYTQPDWHAPGPFEDSEDNALLLMSPMTRLLDLMKGLNAIEEDILPRPRQAIPSVTTAGQLAIPVEPIGR